MPWTEPNPDIISPNPGGVDDPLGESVLGADGPWCRVFEPQDTRIVIGRHQKVHREVLVEHAQADGIPIHRRLTGGGAVVLAPGMLVVALRIKVEGYQTEEHLYGVGQTLASLVTDILPEAPLVVRGHGDLALVDKDGERKVLGASLRGTRGYLVYLGALLIEDAVPLMERYLQAPSRQPDYRSGRGHRAFCTSLSQWGGSTATLGSQLLETVPKAFADWICPSRLS